MHYVFTQPGPLTDIRRYTEYHWFPYTNPLSKWREAEYNLRDTTDDGG